MQRIMFWATFIVTVPLWMMALGRMFRPVMIGFSICFVAGFLTGILLV